MIKKIKAKREKKMKNKILLYFLNYNNILNLGLLNYFLFFYIFEILKINKTDILKIYIFFSCQIIFFFNLIFNREYFTY